MYIWAKHKFICLFIYGTFVKVLLYQIKNMKELKLHKKRYLICPLSTFLNVSFFLLAICVSQTLFQTWLG